MTPIIYLHGFASGPGSIKATYFRRYLEAAGATVEIPDLAAGDFEHLTLSGQLAVIEQSTARRTVSLIGSSMGGYLAALYAARHPEVDRVVLLAPAFGFARRWRERLGENAVVRWRATGRIEVFHYGLKQPAWVAYRLLEDAEQYEDYPDLRQPCLIFHGAQDDVVPARYSQEFAELHSNARLEILNSGHELTDRLDYMAPALLEFLR